MHIEGWIEEANLTMARAVVHSMYVLCACAALSLAWLFATGGFSGIFPTGRFGPVTLLAAIACVALALVFLLISARLYWWGKFLCAGVALSWLGNAAISYMMEFETPVAWVAAAGIVVLSTAVIHQIVYPQLGK